LSDQSRNGFGNPVSGLLKLHECVAANEDGVAGTLIVIDELGKLLEYAASNPDRSSVYALQELAEAASRTTTPMLLVGVLHQDFSVYARGLPPEERQEWEKIRGRFEDILFDEPADQMLRLLARTVDSEGPTGHDEKLWQLAMNSMHEVGAIPRGLDTTESAELFRRCWPLHPLTAVVLGSVFKRYGQNERSAFSFVQSNEPFGLRDFRANPHASERRMYTLDCLFEYMTSTLGDNLLSNRDGKRWAEAIDLERRLADCEPQAIAVFRTVGLLSIIGRWHDLAATPQNVALAMMPLLDKRDTEIAVQSLRDRSVVVFRKFNNTIAPWEGSDVDIEAKLASARSSLPESFDVARTLSKYFRPRPVIARRHSFETGTLRVFSVEYIDSAVIEPNAQEPSHRDGRILVLLNIEHDTHRVAEVARRLAEMPSALLAVPSNSRELTTLTRELAAIDAVRRGTPELAGDSIARRELDARESDVRRRLSVETSSMLFGDAHQTTTKWFRNGRLIKVRDSRELNERLSDICSTVFDSAPLIRNEIINRSELSSSAAAARRNLIEAMIERPDVEELGIEGNPPERSIYLSVLRELGLHSASKGGCRFSADPERCRNEAGPLLRGFHAFFATAEVERRSIRELFETLRAPPYGLRDGVLPIILCAVLQACESEVALYEDGAFLPQLTIESFERLMKSPESFTVRRWRVTGVRTAVFQQLASMLGAPATSGRAGRAEVLDVVKPMLRFFRKLDQYTQSTRSLSPAAIAVRLALSTATEPDQLLFADLPTACGVAPFDSRTRGRDEDVARYLLVLQQALSELQRAYDALLALIQRVLAQAFIAAPSSSLIELRQAATEHAHAVSSVAVDPDLRSFVDRILEGNPDDRQWLESLAALLAAKPPTVWRDEDRDRFEVSLSQRVRRLQSLAAIAREHTSPQSRARGGQTFRLAVAGSALRDHEIVLQVTDAQISDVEALAATLHSQLTGLKDISRGIVLAALAHLIDQQIRLDPSTKNTAGVTE